MATSDLITDGKSFILSVINSTENLSVNLSDVTFGPPVKPTGALPLRNTKVIITPKSYSGYYGVKTVWYNRIHINQLGTIKVEKGIATHVVQLIPAINEKYGIFLTDDDIIDDVLPTFQTGEITVNLQISPNSYMFYSGDVIITQDFDPGVSGFNLIPSVWDTDYKSTLITNSSELNSLQVINSDPGISMIRTNNSFQTGKRYFEFSVPSDNGVIGLATAAAGMDVLIGSDENSFGIYPFEGKIRHNNQVVYTTNQLPLFGNRTIGVMVDLDNATLGFILQGNIRVDVPNVILPTAPLYVVVGNSSDTKILNNQLTNFGQIPFKYTVPVGYVPGFGIGGSPVVPTAGALIRTKCVGFTKVGIYANGAGGTYSDVIETNSSECGYGMTTPSTTATQIPTTSVTPTPTATGTGSPTVTGSTPSPTLSSSGTESPITTESPTTTETPITTSAPTSTTTPPPINLNLTWTTTTIPSVGYAQIVNMFYNAGKYVLINNGAGITTSDNDFSTVTVNNTLRDKVNEVLPGELDNSFELQRYVSFFENGYYCVLSRNGWLFTSNDLITWNAIDVNAIVGYSFGGFGGSVYCPSISKQLIVCIDGSVISSSDYINWTTYTGSNIDQFFSFTTMRRIIKLNNFYYAYSWNDTGSYSESFVRSTDGITWSALTDLNTKVVDALGNTSGYLSLATNGTRLVMLLGTAYLTAHSDDNGDTWSIDHNLQSLGWDANLTSSKTLLANIEYIDGRFVVVGGKQPNTWLAFSLDGITWERHTAIESSNILASMYTGYDAMDILRIDTDKYLVYANNLKIATSFVVNLTPPTSSPTPTFPPAGTIIGTPWCSGFNKEATIADGNGGSYSDIIETNSPDCGYVAPTTTPAPTVIDGNLGITWVTKDIGIGTRTEGIVYNSNTNLWVAFTRQGEIATSTDLVAFVENITLKDKMAYLAINDPISSNFYPNEVSHNFIELIDGIYFVPGNNGWLYTSTDLTNWNAVNIYAKYNQTTGQPQGDQLLTTVAKIGTNYVAALRYTESIQFISSTDGVTWNTFSNELSANILNDFLTLGKIVKLNDRYFAYTIDIGYPVLFSSFDGNTWTFATGTNTNVKAMASNGTRIVSLLLNQNKVAYSDNNGNTWTTSTGLQSMGWTGQNNSGLTQLTSITYASDRFVVVGVLNGVVICATSTDGITWERQSTIEQLSITDSNYDGWEGTKVVYANNKLIVVAGANHILAVSPYITPPGTTVTPTTTETPTTTATPTPTAVIQWANTTVIPISTSGQYAGSSQICNGLLADTTNWVIVGDNLEIATTTDFITYTTNHNLLNLAINYADGMEWNDFNQLISRKPYSLSKVNDRYFVIGTKGALFSSLNLTNWSVIIFNFTDPTNANSSAIWIGSDNRYRFITNTGDAMISSIEDGVLNNLTWDVDAASTLQTSFNNTTIDTIQVKKLGTYYYAFSKGKSYVLLRSADGITWTPILGALTQAYFNATDNYIDWIVDIAFNGTKLVVLLGSSYLIATSNDNGDTWSITYSFQSIAWTGNAANKPQSIVWTGTQFVALYNNGYSTSSPDGVTWTDDTNYHTLVGSTTFLGPDNGDTSYIKYGNGKLVALSKSDNLMIKNT